MAKKILIFVLVLLVGIQFIRPAKNQSTTATAQDIMQLYQMSDSVKLVLQKACYDCHSNNTRYYWYHEIMPLGWWLADHVNDGKKHLNFSEFGTYKPKKQDHKLEECEDEVKEGEMPLDSYTWVHKD